MKKFLAVAMLAVFFVFTGCKNNNSNSKKEEITTDVVKNNKSADGESQKPMPKIVFEKRCMISVRSSGERS